MFVTIGSVLFPPFSLILEEIDHRGYILANTPSLDRCLGNAKDTLFKSGVVYLRREKDNSVYNNIIILIIWSHDKSTNLKSAFSLYFWIYSPCILIPYPPLFSFLIICQTVITHFGEIKCIDASKK